MHALTDTGDCCHDVGSFSDVGGLVLHDEPFVEADMGFSNFLTQGTGVVSAFEGS